MVEYFQEHGDVRSAMECHGQEGIRFGEGYTQGNTIKAATKVEKKKEEKVERKSQRRKRARKKNKDKIQSSLEQNNSQEPIKANEYADKKREPSDKEKDELELKVTNFNKNGRGN